MIAFQVSLNGETMAVAGRDDLGVLSAIVTASGVLGRASSGIQGKASGYDLDLDVGGLTSKGKGQPDEHVGWVQFPALSVGDEITVKIIEMQAADPPTRSDLTRPLLAEGERSGEAPENLSRVRPDYEHGNG